MSRPRLIMMLASATLALLTLAASYARNEEAVGFLSMVAGCALIVLNKQFTHEALSERNVRSSYEYRLQEKLGRVLAVIVGLGFVAWGAWMLLGIGHIRGWN